MTHALVPRTQLCTKHSPNPPSACNPQFRLPSSPNVSSPLNSTLKDRLQAMLMNRVYRDSGLCKHLRKLSYCLASSQWATAPLTSHLDTWRCFSQREAERFPQTLPHPCHSKCGPSTGSLSWELVREAESPGPLNPK